jgi:hypothetical protein
MKYILILFIATLIGCGKSDFQSEINTVNDLISEYDSLFVVVKSFDISSAKPSLKKYNESLDYSKTQLSSDKNQV